MTHPATKRPYIGVPHKRSPPEPREALLPLGRESGAGRWGGGVTIGLRMHKRWQLSCDDG